MEKNSALKIAVIGAESTGKTTLCEALAAHYKAALVPEYARMFFNTANIHQYALSDLEHIAQQQVMLETQAANSSGGLLFCDTTVMTIKIWAELEFQTCPDSILSLLKQTKYDFYLITENDVPWEKDDQRLNKYKRQDIFDRHFDELIVADVPYAIVNGVGPQRTENAIRHINALIQYKVGT